MTSSRRWFAPAATLFALALSAGAVAAQEDASRAVANGGIHAPGWAGRIDPQEAANGMKLEHAAFMLHGSEFHVKTGPAVTYWNPANRATGSYTVKATFTEPLYMNINNHPHPYGIVIAGNDLGTDGNTFLYCSAYGNGTYIVRGFGPAPFQVSARRPEANDAINKAADRNQPVTQEIAMSVHPDRVECAINGKVVATYPKSDVVGEGKLKSTDGIYGLRFGHNTEVMVKGLTLTRH